MNTINEAPEVTARRHAAALSEVTRMREDHDRMQSALTEAYREIDQLRNKVDLLKDDNDHYRQHAAVFQRKLIRLASAMSAICKLSAEAEVIMRDAKEFEEAMDQTDREDGGQTATEVIQQLRGIARTENPA